MWNTSADISDLLNDSGILIEEQDMIDLKKEEEAEEFYSCYNSVHASLNASEIGDDPSVVEETESFWNVRIFNKQILCVFACTAPHPVFVLD
jgi:hypothetical protein